MNREKEEYKPHETDRKEINKLIRVSTWQKCYEKKVKQD